MLSRVKISNFGIIETFSYACSDKDRFIGKEKILVHVLLLYTKANCF